jgi:hypothetical protein
MNLLAPGAPLDAIKGKARVAIVDHLPPLSSPITLLVMVLKAAGFEWYGARKSDADGREMTTAYLDTVSKATDGTERRRVTWTLIGDQTVDIAGDPCGLHQICAALGYPPPGRQVPPPRPGAAALLAELRRVLPLTGEMPFNARGKALLAASLETSNPEARRWIADLVEIYRGYCWKLSTPADHPPHPEYGYPLDRHLRYVRGKRKGDVRQSLCYDARMEELRMLGLR